ncbi:MAG: DUF5104 domain-containing protein [Clostridiales bacterium]|nr:DUF5104 domain-containing protein [Clostridiales bacterium]
MIRSIIITVLLVVACMFSGCGVISPEAEKLKSNVSTYEKQKDISKTILEMLVNRDSSGLYDMFSSYKRENESIDNQIDELFALYDFSEFDMEQVEYNSVNGEQTYRDGRIVFMTLSDTMKNIRDNDDIEVWISYYYIVTDEKEPNKEGLVGLTIIRVEDKNRFRVG